MEVTPGPAVRIDDGSAVAQARRLVAEQARMLEWDATAVGRAELVVTELATNVLKHAKDGCIAALRVGQRLQLLAIDRGQGIPSLESSFTPGYSTAGTAGNGLPAIQRLSDRMDLVSTAARGVVIALELTAAHRPGQVPLPHQPAAPLGGLSVPRAGESVCGDGWAVHVGEAVTTVLVCDGLGHGGSAADAANQAVNTFRQRPEAPPAESLERVHHALRATRGAAAAIAWIDRRDSRLRYTGIGNIATALVHGGSARHLVSHNGIVGHIASRFMEYTHPWEPGDVLVMQTDGVSSRWRAEDYPGLFVRSGSAIAGTLYRDHARERDDASLVALRLGQPGQ